RLTLDARAPAGSPGRTSPCPAILPGASASSPATCRCYGTGSPGRRTWAGPGSHAPAAIRRSLAGSGRGPPAVAVDDLGDITLPHPAPLLGADAEPLLHAARWQPGGAGGPLGK